MKWSFVSAAVLIGQFLCAQDTKPWNVGRLCGRLDHVERIPDRKHPDNASETRKALRDVSLVLYERSEKENCCENLKPIDTIITSKGGRFEFKNKKPGLYWLKTDWNGEDYKLAVVYKPEKDSEEVCSEQGMRVDDSGKAGWWLTILVD